MINRNILPNSQTMSEYKFNSYYNMSMLTDTDGFSICKWEEVTVINWRGLQTTVMPIESFLGKTITVSCDLQCDDFENLNNVRFRLDCYEDSIMASSARCKWISLTSYPTSKNWVRVTKTVTIDDLSFFNSEIWNSNTPCNYVSLWIFNGTLCPLQVKKLKIEYGDTATEWSPAPEDAKSNIHIGKSDLNVMYLGDELIYKMYKGKTAVYDNTPSLPTPLESDFTYEITSDGGINLTEYSGELTSFIVPASIDKRLVTTLSRTFFGNSNVVKIILPHGIITLNVNAFGNCTALTSITIPSSVTTLDNGAFGGCSGLSTITYQGTIQEWNNIQKLPYWNTQSAIKTIECTDGIISL